MKYEPVLLIMTMGERLDKEVVKGKRQFSIKYLASQHLSYHALSHFRNVEAVTVMQIYAALRILLLDEPSMWGRILLVCAFIDLLEQCFCQIFSVPSTFPRPFAVGMKAALEDKMSALLDYDLSKVLK